MGKTQRQNRKYHQDEAPRFICEMCTNSLVGFPLKLTVLQAKLHYRLTKHVVRTEK